MTRYAHLDPAPFSLLGGDVGCLLIHGYTGAPPEMRLVGEYLAARGIAVEAPLLPGHGTEPADLNRVTWQDWVTAAEASLGALRSRCRRVFVAGLSLGSLITLYLGATHPDIDGLVPYSPAILVTNKLLPLVPVLKYVFRFWPKGEENDDLTDPHAAERLWSYEINPTWAAHEVYKFQRLVRANLPAITQPIQIWHSTGDATIDPRCGQIVLDEVGSTDKELITLHDSGHCITVDSEYERVCQGTYKFIQSRS